MKILYIHRHAKAVKESCANDFDRNLRPSGIEDAHRMGRYIAHREFISERILASPAARAVQTARLISEHTGERILEDNRLYGAGWPAILSVLREQPSGIDAIRVLGHNPDLELLCCTLCGIRQGGIRLATCGIFCVSCEISSWENLREGTGMLEWSIRPVHL